MNDTVRQWVTKAEADYASAAREMGCGEQCNLDLVLFLCQQCVEKLMKALLMTHGTVVPKTHDLTILSGLVRSAEPDLRLDDTELRWLTSGAVDYLYPGESADEEDARKAFHMATTLKSQIRAKLHMP